MTRVDRHYFDAMGIPVREGRGFSERDTPSLPVPPRQGPSKTSRKQLTREVETWNGFR